jgi:hypothetical protein
MYRSHPASGDGALRLVGESLYVTAYSGKHCMFADLQIGGNFKEVERLLQQSVRESGRVKLGVELEFGAVEMWAGFRVGS